jgi:mannose-1-phosphate guanylyltransferase/mannose-6-phosphate isomerase
MKRRNENDEINATVKRPWGTYTVLERGFGYKIKKVVIFPQKKLSLQFHKQRSEHWVVIKGMAKVILGEKEIIINVDQSVYVPKGHIHRLENSWSKKLEIIEVQCGKYLEEDDIVRLEDDFKRC